MILVFTGGEHPSSEHLKKTLATLDDESIEPFIIVADSGLSFCLKAGYTPSFICGDMDSIEGVSKPLDIHLKKMFPFVELSFFSRDKDETDTEIALKKAHEKMANTAHKKIVLIGADGGRLDHLLAALKVFESEWAPDFWLLKEQWGTLLKEKTSYQLKRRFLRDEFSIFSLSTGKKMIESDGLQWPIDTLLWDKGAYSLSNRIKDDAKNAYVRVKRGRFLLLKNF